MGEQHLVEVSLSLPLGFPLRMGISQSAPWLLVLLVVGFAIGWWACDQWRGYQEWRTSKEKEKAPEEASASRETASRFHPPRAGEFNTGPFTPRLPSQETSSGNRYYGLWDSNYGTPGVYSGYAELREALKSGRAPRGSYIGCHHWEEAAAYVLRHNNQQSLTTFV